MEFQGMAFTIAFCVAMAALIGIILFDGIRKRKNQRRGFEGAEILTETLDESLPEGDYVVMHDVPIMTKMGKSVIDHVIVSVHGIFLLEYRAFVKEIYINEFQHKWGLLIRVREKPFTNPLWQSKVHSLSIRDIVGEKEGLTYYPMAAFADVVEINNRAPREVQPSCFVGNVEDVIAWISQWTDIELTREEVAAIAELIRVNGEKVPDMEDIEVEDGKMPAEYEALLVDPEAPQTVYRNAYGDEITEAEYFARQDALEEGYPADAVVFDLEEGEWVIDEFLADKILEAAEAGNYDPSMLDEWQREQAESK